LLLETDESGLRVMGFREDQDSRQPLFLTFLLQEAAAGSTDDDLVFPEFHYSGAYFLPR
jgi:hypothetical protein